MPILANAKKALRRDNRRNQTNLLVRNQMKAAIKATKEKKLPALLPKAFQTIDRAVKKNLVQKNKAAHLKSQLSKIIASSTKATTKPAPSAKATKATKATKTTPAKPKKASSKKPTKSAPKTSK